MVQVSLQNLAQPQIVSANNMIPQQINTSSNGINLLTIFFVITLLLLFIGLPLIVYFSYYRNINSKASDEASKLK